MIRIIASEYIEKMWIHIVIIIMLSVTMLAGASMLGEIGTKSTMYHSVMDYVDERTIFISNGYEEHVIEEIDKYGNLIINKEYFATDKRQKSSDEKQMIRVRACPDSVMKNMNVRLDAGRKMDKCNVDSDVIPVYITHNNLGINAGDTITLCMDVGDGTHEVDLKVYIAGVLSEGQKIYGFDHLSGNINYTDMFQNYSFEQLGEILVLTSRKEMSRMHEEIACSYSSGILLFDQALSDQQVENVCQDLITYEKNRNFGMSFIESVLPDARQFMDDSENLYAIELEKYIPMIAVFVIISLICLIGIISVKTDMNLKTYTIFRLCGMRCNSMLVCSAVETLMDFICAFVIFISSVIVQNHLLVMDRINLGTDRMTMTAVILYGVMVIGTVIIVTRIILTKNTLVQLLKKQI